MADEMINSYVALDLETTGIGARHEKITEIGMVKVIGGEVADTYHTMVNPHRKIPERIVKLTGITDDMVKGAPGIGEILRSSMSFRLCFNTRRNSSGCTADCTASYFLLFDFYVHPCCRYFLLLKACIMFNHAFRALLHQHDLRCHDHQLKIQEK